MLDQILQRIVGSMEPIVPKDPWHFLRPARGACRLRKSVPETLEELEQEFTAEQLVAARVLVRVEGGELQLSPILTGSRFLVLRQTKDGEACDIVSKRGSLASDDPPAIRCHEDYFTRRWCGKRKTVLVPFSDDDLVVLRMLSVPSTPAAGLEEMTGEQVRRFFKDVANPRRGLPISARPVAGDDYRFVIVGCKIAALVKEQPVGFKETISRLFKVEDSFGFSTSERFGIWEPTNEEFERVCSGVEFADRQLVRRAIWQSVSRSTLSARQFVEKNDAQVGRDLNTARRELIQAIETARSHGFATPELLEKLEAFNRSFSATFVEPIVRDAVRESNPEGQSLHLLAADLMRRWHERSELVQDAERGLLGCFNPQQAELKEDLKIVDRMVKIHRALTRKK